MTPLVYSTMKAIASVVMVSAAMIRSPSFSLLSSSSTTTNLPFAKSASASGMLLKPSAGASQSEPSQRARLSASGLTALSSTDS